MVEPLLGVLYIRAIYRGIEFSECMYSELPWASAAAAFHSWQQPRTDTRLVQTMQLHWASHLRRASQTISVLGPLKLPICTMS